MGGLAAFWDQSFFISSPAFTDKELPDQTGKVHIITGGYTGVGYQLAQLLYAANSTLYIAGRNASKGASALSSLRQDCPNSKGRVEFLQLDLADLPTIKASAQAFLSKETRLDVLVNNAAVMAPPEGSKNAQGFDLTTATNVYGPWLFTVLLLPLMVETAKTAERGSVRVSWAASAAVELTAPKGGVLFGGDGLVDGTLDKSRAYGQSKAANVLLGIETARRWGKDGIISNSFNPGNLRSELARHVSAAQKAVLRAILHPARMGAWTELYAGWSPDITLEKNGCYIIPWGRIGSYNAALQKAGKSKEGGGEGKAEKLWDACEKVCRHYM